MYSMIPDIPDLPEIQAHSISALRLRGAVQAQLPGIPNISTNELLGYNPRAMELARYQEAMRIAYEITRRQNMIAAARAAERDRMLQQLAQRRRAWWR